MSIQATTACCGVQDLKLLIGDEHTHERLAHSKRSFQRLQEEATCIKYATVIARLLYFVMQLAKVPGRLPNVWPIHMSPTLRALALDLDAAFQEAARLAAGGPQQAAHQPPHLPAEHPVDTFPPRNQTLRQINAARGRRWPHLTATDLPNHVSANRPDADLDTEEDDGGRGESPASSSAPMLPYSAVPPTQLQVAQQNGLYLHLQRHSLRMGPCPRRYQRQDHPSHA